MSGKQNHGRRTSAKSQEDVFKGSVKDWMKTGIKSAYKRGDVNTYARALIKAVADKNLSLSDKEIAAKVVERYGGATSVKAIQWYRFQMRKDGVIEAASQRAPKSYLTELTYEVIDPAGAIKVLTAKKLITFGRAELIADGGTKTIAMQSIYSVPTAVAFLTNIGYEIIDQNTYESEVEDND
jgi:hypothetical protein